MENIIVHYVEQAILIIVIVIIAMLLVTWFVRMWTHSNEVRWNKRANDAEQRAIQKGRDWDYIDGEQVFFPKIKKKEYKG